MSEDEVEVWIIDYEEELDPVVRDGLWKYVEISDGPPRIWDAPEPAIGGAL